jgi:cytochrome c oxidase accessory protein FixG
MSVLLGIYYGVPWIRWDRGPHVPDQAVLIDMASRRAYFFFIEIWPQEVYFLAGLLILAAIGLFFVTSLFGRVWCGYACPQTVWTDLFTTVERWIQGDRNQRVKLDAAPMSVEKVWKKSLTHIIWIIIGLCTGGAWVFYFNDAPTLWEQITHLHVPWSVGGWILGLTTSTYIMAGYAREQVCTYMCPYARFQSAMFDKDTLIIGYDAERGEQRGKHRQGESWEGRGHCIDCSLCVQVCPVGIDIREGLQMECIACGLCVDACNSVMDKLQLPPGLIRYDTSNNQEARREALKINLPFKDKLHLMRPRTIYYSVVLALIGAIMLYALMHRGIMELHVLHERNPLFVQLSNGDIRNSYTVKILNKTHQDRNYALSVDGLKDSTIKVMAADELDPKNLPVFADSVGQFRLQIIAPPNTQLKRQEITLNITDTNDGEKDDYSSIFVSGQ